MKPYNCIVVGESGKRELPSVLKSMTLISLLGSHHTVVVFWWLRGGKAIACRAGRPPFPADPWILRRTIRRVAIRLWLLSLGFSIRDSEWAPCCSKAYPEGGALAEYGFGGAADDAKERETMERERAQHSQLGFPSTVGRLVDAWCSQSQAQKFIE